MNEHEMKRKRIQTAIEIRLESCNALFEKLNEEKDVDTRKIIFEEIMDICQRSLVQLEEQAVPYLSAQTHIFLAASHLGLMKLSTLSDLTENNLRQAGDHADIAAELSKDIFAKNERLDILLAVRDIFVELGERSEGLLRLAISARLKGRQRDYDDALLDYQKMGKDAADMLFSAQMLVEGAKNLSDKDLIIKTLINALAMAEVAQKLLFETGLEEAGRQAAETAAEAESLLTKKGNQAKEISNGNR